MAEDKSTKIMKYIILIVASLVFIFSAIVKLINPEKEDINTVSNVFLIVSGLVFGSNVVGFFKKPGKEE